MEFGRPLKITTALCNVEIGMVNTQPKETQMCEFDGRCGRTICVAARWMLKRRSTAPRWPRRGPTRPPRWPKTGPRRPQDGPRQPIESATNRGEETLQKK